MNAGIELRHLRYFVCLAEELHFGRAAERLGIQQAPLSQQIKILEGRIGAPLLHRTTRRTRLTAAGETLLGHARALLDEADRAVAHTRAMAGEATGRIAVAGIQVALSHLLPPVLAAFRTRRPAVIVDVAQMGTADQLRALERGAIDVALLRPTDQAAFMCTEVLAHEGLIAALPAGHQLAAQRTLALTDFDGQPMIAYAAILGAGYAGIAQGALRRAGARPRVVQEAAHTMGVAALVASGLGVAIMPAWIAGLAVPGVAFRPVRGLDETLDLVIAWPRGGASPLVLDLVETARRVSADAARPGGLLPRVGKPR